MAGITATSTLSARWMPVSLRGQRREREQRLVRQQAGAQACT